MPSEIGSPVDLMHLHSDIFVIINGFVVRERDDDLSGAVDKDHSVLKVNCRRKSFRRKAVSGFELRFYYRCSLRVAVAPHQDCFDGIELSVDLGGDGIACLVLLSETGISTLSVSLLPSVSGGTDVSSSDRGGIGFTAFRCLFGVGAGG